MKSEYGAGQPGFSRKLLLFAAAVFPLAVPYVFGQDSTAIKIPQFEVSTVKPNKSGSGVPIIRPTPDGIRATYVTLMDLIRDAYGNLKFGDDRITGAPDWANSDRYDMQAKVVESRVRDLRNLDEDQQRLMRQLLLADRFKLTTHTTTKELPVYELILSKSGPKLKTGTSVDGFPTGVMHVMNGQLTAQGVSIERLARMLMLQLTRPVVDKTGLAGTYDFALQWPTGANGSADSGQPTTAPLDSSEPSIFTAVQQLGLTLKPSKGPVEILVIDHVERPSEN